MSRAAVFRKQAQTCLANAECSREDDARLAWLEMANQWHHLAQEAEEADDASAPAAVVLQQQQIQPD